MMGKEDRPRNIGYHRLVLDFQWTLTMGVSILNRAAGILLFPGVAFILYLLGASLESESSFEAVRADINTPVYAFLLWAILSALFYHIVLGMKHLLMDLGIGETLESSRLAAKISIVVNVAGIAYLAYYFFS